MTADEAFSFFFIALHLFTAILSSSNNHGQGKIFFFFP